METVTYTVRVPLEMMIELKKIKAREGIPISFLILSALRKFLKERKS